jgi:cold shock CspA family protein
MIGRVKNVQAVAGYGFLACEDGVDRFFHQKHCVAGMELTDAWVELYVEFEPALRSKGPCAINVRLLPHTPVSGLGQRHGVDHVE